MRNPIDHTLKLCAVGLMAATFVACSDSDNSGGQESKSEVTMGVTDAPVDSATRVVVQFTGIEFKRQGEFENVIEEFDEPRQIDLLALQGSNQELLIEDFEVPAGDYSFVRLHVDANRGVEDSFIELDDGSIHSLFIPSGSQSGLQLNGPFTLEADAATAFTIDFDLRKSVTAPEGQQDYFLRPTLRIVTVAQAGHIEGTATLSQLQEENCSNDLAADTGSAVYVYQGTDVEPDDVGGSGPQPVSSGLVTMDSSTGEFGFEVGFLLEGSYTVALTCQASDDDPEQDDDIVFSETQNAEVQAGETTTVTFGSS